MDGILEVFKQIDTVFQMQFLPIGKSRISLYMIVYMGVLMTALILVTNRIKKWTEEKLLTRTAMDIGLRQAIGSITRYFVIFFGSLIILQTAGIDLSSFTVLAGALGLGVSFGLQTITANLVSGLIILFERPIKVGDRIEVDGASGDVVRISLRATTIVTNDNIAIIVPNSEFIKGKITNWSYASENIRFGYAIPVALDADPQKAADIILAVAMAHPGVLKEPPPDVIFLDMGEKALNFNLRVYTRDYLTRPASLRSELNFAVHKALKENDLGSVKAAPL